MARKAASRKPAATAASGGVSLLAPADFNIVQASALHADWLPRLLDAADAPQPWVLDASAVQEFDSAALQLMLALKRGLVQQGQTLSLQSPSAVVLAALQTYGLDQSLEPLAFAD
ncbi:STAS domain-containing protein [Roseateles paludis]|jgi:anti-anti-sigma regulatory factor|uniref:STAS domain-containing protein n=1 Tax=Roseateles paludis TaxID=3145238 RepID=A0ABV0G2M5_9BURK